MILNLSFYTSMVSFQKVLKYLLLEIYPWMFIFKKQYTEINRDHQQILKKSDNTTEWKPCMRNKLCNNWIFIVAKAYKRVWVAWLTSVQSHYYL